MIQLFIIFIILIIKYSFSSVFSSNPQDAKDLLYNEQSDQSVGSLKWAEENFGFSKLHLDVKNNYYATTRAFEVYGTI